MRLRHVEIFYHVYREGSISGAARTLHVSQPSVSKTLRHAEDQLGFSLFDRIKGRLQPTAAADELFNEVCDIYDRMTSFDRTASNIRNRAGGHIRLGALPSIGFAVAPELVSQMRMRDPDLSFDVSTLHTDEINDALLERRYDLCFGFGCIDDERITQHHIAEVELVLLSKTKLAPVPDGKINIAALDDVDLIGLTDSGPVADLANRNLEQAGISQAHAVAAHTHYVAASLVRLGVGAAIVDKFTADSVVGEGLTITRFVEPFFVPFTAMHLTSGTQQRSVNECIELLSKRFA